MIRRRERDEALVAATRGLTILHGCCAPRQVIGIEKLRNNYKTFEAKRVVSAPPHRIVSSTRFDVPCKRAGDESAACLEVARADKFARCRRPGPAAAAC